MWGSGRSPGPGLSVGLGKEPRRPVQSCESLLSAGASPGQGGVRSEVAAVPSPAFILQGFPPYVPKVSIVECRPCSGHGKHPL